MNFPECTGPSLEERQAMPLPEYMALLNEENAHIPDAVKRSCFGAAAGIFFEEPDSREMKNEI